MPDQAPDPQIVTLKNVRLSFPHLFTAHAMQAGQEAKFSANFIFDNQKHAKLLDDIEALAERLALDTFKKKIRLTGALIRDGNEFADKDGYGDGTSFLAASRKSRPAVVDRQCNPLAEEDGVIYAGCYVNATIRLWVQNNEFGKRVNAELRAVQFVRDGEAFGAAPVDPSKEFQPLGDDDGAGSTARTATRSTGRSGAKTGKDLDSF